VKIGYGSVAGERKENNPPLGRMKTIVSCEDWSVAAFILTGGNGAP